MHDSDPLLLAYLAGLPGAEQAMENRRFERRCALQNFVSDREYQEWLALQSPQVQQASDRLDRASFAAQAKVWG